MKPVKRKRLLDANNWYFDGQDNKAIPDIERIPCLYDDVIFDNVVDLELPNINFKVNSVKMLNKLSSFYNEFYLNPTPNQCTKKSGCLCREDYQIFGALCDNMQKKEVNCFGAISAIGFCSDICGNVNIAFILRLA